jgi:1-acyl-sn-glycerol-3-phosphate acyltransferase
MADADIVPIGGRGEPGRGSRTSRAAGRPGGPGAVPRPRDADAAPEKPASTSRRRSADAAAPDAIPKRGRKPSAAASTTTPGPKEPPKARKTQPADPQVVETSDDVVAGSRAMDQAAKPRSRPRARPVMPADTDSDTDRDTDPVVRSIRSDPGAASTDETLQSASTSAADAEAAASSSGLSADDIVEAIVVAAKLYFGEVDWEQKLAELLAFARRRITGDYEIDEFGFDEEITEHFLFAVLRPLAEKWFRIEVHGIENIPTDGGALVVSNHSGTVPLDGLMTGLVIHDHAHRYLRALGADLVFRLPFVGEIARKSGATLASNEDAELMLSRGDLVGVWPEGFKGIGKPFSERYKLQRFGRGGFVSAALRTGVPIVPCSVVGAEEIYPLVGNVPSLARLLGVPYFPITPFFPWLGPLGMVPLPSKWHIEFGEPIRTDTYGDGSADDPMLVFNVTDQVRETIQQTLYSLLIQRQSVFS